MLKRLFNRTPKSHRVYIEPFGATVTVGARETLLDAALRAGLAYPFECRTGACSTCRTQLLEGEIKALTDFAYVLDVEQMRGGTILACQSLAKSDLKLRVTTLDDGSPVIAPRRFSGEVRSVDALTRDIVDVRVALDGPMRYYAGQYANLSVPGVQASRSYSFATAPADAGSTELSFHIRLIPGGEVSGWFAADARAGAAVEVEGPYGVFRLREADVPILCIAGGSGMAPIAAMLQSAGRRRVSRPVVFLYGARTLADLYDEGFVTALREGWAGPWRFQPVLSEEPADSGWTGARGLVTGFIRAVDDFNLQGCQAYLCGPPAMIDAALPILTNAGVRGRDIYFDKFIDRSHAAGA